MTSEQAIKMAKAELECIELQTNGIAERCNNDCENCSLCYEQGNMGEQKEWLKMAIKALENQCPSKGVDCEDCHANEPKAKVGKWISIYGNVKCSICGNVKDGRSVGKATHYCDFCGAKMESEVEE